MDRGAARGRRTGRAREAHPRRDRRGAAARLGRPYTGDRVRRLLPWLPLSRDAEDGIVFTHAADQRVYRWRPGTDPVPLSPAGAWPGELRYADFAVHGDEVWCLREAVSDEAALRAVRHLVALPLDGSAHDDPSAVRELASGHDFLTGPRIEPGGAGWPGSAGTIRRCPGTPPT